MGSLLTQDLQIGRMGFCRETAGRSQFHSLDIFGTKLSSNGVVLDVPSSIEGAWKEPPRRLL